MHRRARGARACRITAHTCATHRYAFCTLPLLLLLLLQAVVRNKPATSVVVNLASWHSLLASYGAAVIDAVPPVGSPVADPFNIRHMPGVWVLWPLYVSTHRPGFG